MNVTSCVVAAYCEHYLDAFLDLETLGRAVVLAFSKSWVLGAPCTTLVFTRSKTGGPMISPDIEVIAIQDINDAYSMVEHGEVRFRYVIDMSTLKADAHA